MKKFEVIPEIHGFINYDFNPKTPKISIILDRLVEPIPIKISKPNSALYNLGFGFTAKTNIMEYEKGYDSYLAKKYIAHQETLKIRVIYMRDLKLNFKSLLRLLM